MAYSIRLDSNTKNMYIVKHMEIIELLTILKEGESETIEFKESPSKEIKRAACAFANSNGGRILVGIKDDGTPVGIKDKRWRQEISDQLQNLRPVPKFTMEEMPIANAIILVITIEKANTLVSTSNTVYIRAGTNNYPLSIEEVIEKSSESLRVYFDQLVTHVPAKNLDEKLVTEYLNRRERNRGVKAEGDLLENAIKMKAAQKRGTELYLTNGGILCFTHDPQKYLNNAVVRVVQFKDNEMKGYSLDREFVGTLQEIVSDLEKFFIGQLNRIGGFSLGFSRGEILEYPFQALREAIINSIVHRNYFDASDIKIFIFPDRIEIKNPGSFPLGVSVESPVHKPRNPLLAQYFYDMGLTEKYGSGIMKIINETKAHPLTDVYFELRPYNTTVVFKKVRFGIDLDDINTKIIEFLAGGAKSSSEIAKYTGISRQAIVGRLNNLKLLGIVIQIGEGSKTAYQLIK
jgi:ATP-dependent DNA helicase RecG